MPCTKRQPFRRPGAGAFFPHPRASLPLALILLVVCASTSFARIPDESRLLTEIRTIIAEKAFHQPSAAQLAALSMDQLNQQLLAMDPNASYRPPEPSDQSLQGQKRIGLTVIGYKGRLWASPEPGGPAQRQGVPEIGELRAINATAVGYDVHRAGRLLDAAIRQGKVVLTINGSATRRYDVTPEIGMAAPVVTRTAGAYTLLQIVDFVTHETAPHFSSLYTVLNRSKAHLMLDLRGCTGGDLFEALEIAGMFLPAGSSLITTHDHGGKTHTYLAPEGGKLALPRAVLVDGRTASAAEILVAALQKSASVPVIGERTYGKCESQTVFKLSNGGELWLTTQVFQYADEAPCARVGIQPDMIYPDITIARAADIIAWFLAHQ